MENHFLLVPYFLDQPRYTLVEVLEEDWSVYYNTVPHATTMDWLANTHNGIAETVEGTVRAGARPVVVAGDCCATIGVLAGLQRAGVKPTLLWLDAHGDFNTWETTPSGFLGGMPLAMLVGRGEQTLVDAVELETVDEARVVLADARDLDVEERAALENSKVLRLADLKAVLASERLQAPVYVHFDTDLVNPKDAPAQAYATAGGPTAAEVREFFAVLAASGKVAAVSMCAWNPQLDTDGKSREVCMDLLGALVL